MALSWIARLVRTEKRHYTTVIPSGAQRSRVYLILRSTTDTIPQQNCPHGAARQSRNSPKYTTVIPSEAQRSRVYLIPWSTTDNAAQQALPHGAARQSRNSPEYSSHTERGASVSHPTEHNRQYSRTPCHAILTVLLHPMRYTRLRLRLRSV